MTTLSTRHFALTDPTATLAAILDAGDARPGRTIIAHIDKATQTVLGVRTLDTPTPSPRHDAASRRAADEARMALTDTLREMALELATPPNWEDETPFPGEFYTVMCREGRVVDTLTEWQFLEAWRFSDHHTNAFACDVYVVTPHGWTGVMDERAGLEPRLTERGATVLTVVPETGTDLRGDRRNSFESSTTHSCPGADLRAIG